MKSTVILVIAMLFLVSLNAGLALADDKKTVADLDTEYQAAVKANDPSTMDRILADDFILVDGDGTVSTKADLLKEARSRRITYEHQEELVKTVRLYGNTAMVTAKLWGKGTDGGKPFEWKLWFSDTYVRTPGGWRYVFGQASLPLPDSTTQHPNVPLPQSPMNTAQANGKVSASAQQLSPTQKEVWAAEESMHRYEQQRDAKQFLSLWDENLVAWPNYEPRPVRKPKIEKDTVEEFQAPQTPGPPLPAPKPEAIGIFGDVAVTHYFWPEADQTSPTVYRATHTWQKGPQGWHIIGGMSCEVPRSPATSSVNISVIPARPEDVISPEAIVKASFLSESGPAGAPRQWARERTLYDPNTISIATGPEAGTGKLAPRRWATFQQYADDMDAYEVKTGFVDRPLACVTNKRAFVATVTCGYEASENGKVVERGVDMFQLYNDGKRWWILSVVWDHESPDNPIPAELLMTN